MKREGVLIIADEVSTYGSNMKVLENIMGMGAGAAKVQVWLIFQGISQLKGMFPQTWQTFIQNCGVTIWFGISDQETCDLVSKMSGTCEVVKQSLNLGTDRQTGDPVIGESYQVATRPLLLPDDVRALPKDESIIFVEGGLTVQSKRRKYWKHFRGFGENPFVKR